MYYDEDINNTLITNKARCAYVKILYDNKDISADIKSYLINMTFDDVLSNEADSITINLQDSENLWKGDWFPTKGAKLTCYIITENWHDDGKIIENPLGIFIIDSIEFSGLPSTVSLKGISIPNNNELCKEKYRAWEKTLLSVICKDIANDGALELIYDVDSDIQIDRAEQIGQTNLEFIQKICNDNGLAIKISNNKLIIFDEYKYECQKAIKEIIREDKTLISYHFKSQLKDIYKGSHVKYQKTDTKEYIEYTFIPKENENIDGKMLEINQEVKDYAEAERLAKKKLREKNKNEVTASMTIAGGCEYAAGLVYKLTGWQKFDGNYIAEKVSHSIGSGYSITIDLRRVLNGY